MKNLLICAVTFVFFIGCSSKSESAKERLDHLLQTYAPVIGMKHYIFQKEGVTTGAFWARQIESKHKNRSRFIVEYLLESDRESKVYFFLDGKAPTQIQACAKNEGPFVSSWNRCVLLTFSVPYAKERKLLTIALGDTDTKKTRLFFKKAAYRYDKRKSIF